MTLLILAAGMGSRYGGLKQIDPIGPNGEFIIDYSIYDALEAGFDKVVFIIKAMRLRICKAAKLALLNKCQFFDIIGCGIAEQTVQRDGCAPLRFQILKNCFDPSAVVDCALRLNQLGRPWIGIRQNNLNVMIPKKAKRGKNP